VFDFLLVVCKQQDVAVNGRGINPVEILFDVIHRVLRVVVAVIRLNAGEIERAPVTGL
jgi:hypothetical protein